MKTITKRFFSALTMIMVGFAAFAAPASEWCDTPTGHLNNPNFGDENSHILLTISGDEAGKLNIVVKPGLDNVKGINYIYVTVSDATQGFYEFGTAQTGEPLAELAIEATLNPGTTTSSIMVQYGNPDWAGRWQVSVSDIDVTANCSGDCDLTENPTMTSASLESKTAYDINLNVAGVDQNSNAITNFVVSCESFTDKVFTATAGVIKIDGLTPGTEYNFSIKAKDYCNNISTGAESVIASTETLESQCSGDKGHFGNPTVLRIHYVISYDAISGNVTYTVTPYNSELTLMYAEIQQTEGGNQIMTIANDAKSATYTTQYTGESVKSLFLYRTSDIPGNEMTAENLTKPEAIYYKVGDCPATSVQETSTAIAKISPNPAVQFVNIVSQEEISKIEVRAQNGAVVISIKPNSNECNLDIAHLAKGRYFVTIYNGAVFNTETMVVK